MLYEKYEQKVLRNYSALKWILTYKIPIIIVVSIVSFALSGYGLSKGQIYDVDIPSEVVFGEALSPDSQAVFSDTEYLYRASGETQWTSEVPIRPGDYQIQVVSNRVFGGNNAEVHDFRILPLGLAPYLESTDIPFGNDPQLIMNLVYGDTVESIEFIYESISDTETIVDVGEIVIKDTFGNIVTDSYDIEFTQQLIQFVPREITVKPLDQTEIYNGQTLTSAIIEFISGSLVEGHRVEVTTSGTQIDVGVSTNTITHFRVFDGEFDVTENYEISFVVGELEITPRPITIETNSDSKVYDGTDLLNETFTVIEGSFVSGEEGEVLIHTSMIHVGSLPNTLSIGIYDQNDNDKTSNYQITYQEGTLEVLHRMITVETVSDQKVYDGTTLSNQGYNITGGSLAPLETSEVFSDTSILNVGTLNNQLTLLIRNSSNYNVTSNYQIQYVEGLLQISEREITIETSNDTKVYDGLNLFNESFYILNGSIVSGHTTEVITNTTIIDVGVSVNVLGVIIKDGNDTDVSSNYDITYSTGTLEITPRAITITTSSDSKIYDGIDFINEGYTLSNGTWPMGHYGAIESNAVLTNVGIINNALAISIFDSDNQDVSSNYDITYIEGTLEVTHRDITITTISDSKVYDSIYLINEGFNVTTGSIAPNQTTSVVDNTSILHVGSVNNVLDIEIRDDQNSDVTNNYNITYIEGTLEVTVQSITVNVLDVSKVYDGTPLVPVDIEYISGSIAINDTASFNLLGSQTNVGDSVSSINQFQILQNQIDVTSNYQIVLQTGDITITPRPITITTSTNQRIYDGTSLIDESYTVTTGSIVANQHGVVVSNTSALTVGDYNNSLSLEIRDSGNGDVSSNYSISYVEGTLSILPRPITITTVSDAKVYDGIDLSNQGYAITSSNLVSGHITEVLTFTTITNAGVTDNILTIVVKNATDIDVSGNYTITYINGTLDISPRPLSVDLQDEVKVYDGTSLTPSTVLITSGNLVSGQTLSYTLGGSQTSVGSSNSIFLELYVMNDLLDVTSNYDITLDTGDLEVTPRDITITTANDAKVYDGIDLINENYTITTGTIAPNQHTIVTSNTPLLNVGIVNNFLVIEIRDVSNNDVSSNYNITYIEGTLEVTSRAITITTSSDTKIYDGIDLIDERFSITTGSIASNQFGVVVSNTSIINVGSINNTLLVEIRDAQNNNVTSNYVITYIEGTLEVTHHLITFTTASDTKMYDGIELFNENYTVTNGSIAQGQTGVVISHTSMLNVGQVNNTLVIEMRDGLNNDVSSNYIITYNEGILEITPRVITVSTNSDSKVYDGLELFNQGYSVTQGSLLIGHTLEVSTYPTITNIGTINNDLDLIVRDGGMANVSYNYSITYQYGTLEITPILITITTSSDSKVYDGLELFNQGYSVTQGSLLSGHTLEISTYPTITNVGTIDNDLDLIVRDGGMADVSSIYLITYQYGTLEITPILLTITTGSDVKVYDDIDLFNVGYTITQGAVLGGHTTEIDAFTAIRNVGTSNNVLSLIVKDALDVDVSSNYLITYSNGTLEITPRLITVTTSNDSKVYDGTSLINEGYNITGGTLVAGHTDSVIANTSLLDVGVVNNTLSLEIRDNGNTAVTGNYSITYIEGTLEITTRSITVTTASDSKIYDGIALINEGFTVTTGSIVLGQTSGVVQNTSITSVGVIPNTLVIEIKDSGNQDVTSNYDITYTEGTLEILPNNGLPLLEIQVFDIVEIYNGVAHSHDVNDYWIPSNNLPTGYTLEFDINGEITTPGVINTFIDESSIRIYDASLNEVTHLFNIVTYSGSIEVVKRAITITLFTVSKIYDGLPLTSDAHYISQGSLVSGDVTNITTTGSITDPGIVVNNIDTVLISDGLGNNVTDHYEITLESGQLIVQE